MATTRQKAAARSNVKKARTTQSAHSRAEHAAEESDADGNICVSEGAQGAA